MIHHPEPEILRVGDLQVDGYVQRTYNANHAENLAKDWDPEQIGIFKVSRRESGAVYVLDGQHRRGAMLKLGMDDDKIFALVYLGLTKAEEAQIFLRDNVNNRKPTVVDIFRLQVAAEVPEAVEINDVLREHGLHVALAGDAHSISAVGALRWLYDMGGVKAIDRTLSMIADAWGPEVRSAREGNLLKGMGYVLLNVSGGKLDVSSLAHKLGAAGKPAQILGAARAHKVATGQALWREVAGVIVATYNKGRTTGRVSI
jgi:hypothetical protein